MTARAERPRYTWDARRGRYRDTRSGRLVSTQDVRRAVDQALLKVEARTAGLTQALRGGTMSLGEWERAMREEIKAATLYSHAAARGGWEQLTAREYGKAGAWIKKQYRYLHGFAEEIAAATQRLDGIATARAGMYAHAARTQYETAYGELVGALGFDEERNVLGHREHCEECPALTARGWVKRDTLPKPGARECMTRCGCRLEYRKSAAAKAAERTRARRNRLARERRRR